MLPLRCSVCQCVFGIRYIDVVSGMGAALEPWGGDADVPDCDLVLPHNAAYFNDFTCATN